MNPIEKIRLIIFIVVVAMLFVMLITYVNGMWPGIEESYGNWLKGIWGKR